MAYFAATFQLLGFEPARSVALEMAVQETEDRLGISLPRSVRDWYVREDAIEILAAHSNDDPPVLLQNVALVEWRTHRLLPFRHENQGVCTWAIAIDGSDDPPVYVDVDSGGREWQPFADSFSSYVYSCVWDYRMVFRQPVFVQAQNAPLSSSALAALAADFREELQTHGWPGNTQHRFYRNGQAVLIWSSQNQADWFVAAGEVATLEVALMVVWSLDDVGKSFYADSEAGKNTLDKLRVKAYASESPIVCTPDKLSGP